MLYDKVSVPGKIFEFVLEYINSVKQNFHVEVSRFSCHLREHILHGYRLDGPFQKLVLSVFKYVFH
jgi:hypothetical protein